MPASERAVGIWILSHDQARLYQCSVTPCLRATSHTRLIARDITFQALSLVEKAEPVQVCYFTLRLRDQRRLWMQDGCESQHGFLTGIEWIMSCGHLDYFQNPPFGGRSITKLGDHGTPYTHIRWFILFYHVWGPAWIQIYWNNIWLRACSHMTSHCTWGSVTTLHGFGGVSGRPLNTFLEALTISWSHLLACVWSGPRWIKHCYKLMLGGPVVSSIYGGRFMVLTYYRDRNASSMLALCLHPVMHYM